MNRAHLFLRGNLFCIGNRIFAQNLLSFVLHLIEFYTRTQKHVVRSTWAAELFDQVDAADVSLLLLGFYQEIETGVKASASDLINLRTLGGYHLNWTQFTDCKSIVSAITSENVKTPSEKNTIHHAQWIRELLDNHILTEYHWCDTRDMVADGMNKGSIDRTAIIDLMKGKWNLKHETIPWSSTKRRTTL